MSELNWQRNNAYRREMDKSLDESNDADFFFHAANLSLDELRQRTSAGIEPRLQDLEHVRHRFDQAEVAAIDDGDVFATFSARLLGAYVAPIAWSRVVNLDSLGDGASKRVLERTGLGEAIDQTYSIVADGLTLYDGLKRIPSPERTKEDRLAIRDIVGFLNEATPLLLYGRHHTPKLFATPTLSYDDQLNEQKGRRVDVDFFDNRTTRTKPHYAVQVKTSPHSIGGPYARNGKRRSYDPDIPMLYACDFGNDDKFRYWPRSKRRFTTLRMLLHEHNGTLSNPQATSTLDKIASDVYKKVETHSTAAALAAGTGNAYRVGKEIGQLVAAMNKKNNESIAS